MAPSTADASGRGPSKFLERFGWDLLLGSIAAFYVFTVPYTKVEESFNVQLLCVLLFCSIRVYRLIANVPPLTSAFASWMSILVVEKLVCWVGIATDGMIILNFLVLSLVLSQVYFTTISICIHVFYFMQIYARSNKFTFVFHYRLH
ncbi:hypothetical protein Taro_007618 [Colocasia esculenta]|uniref:Uncharacterized protein n=1 Tax=Colocasia esculenta TaxID=4460 RepID=A0A843U052_COLES|nr:hypothetical protein [Colocasia esculenta]